MKITVFIGILMNFHNLEKNFKMTLSDPIKSTSFSKIQPPIHNDQAYKQVQKRYKSKNLKGLHFSVNCLEQMQKMI